MVTVISGGSHSGRDEIFISNIKSAVKNGEQVMVIIPDQFSFEYDKKLYEQLGAADFNRIQTAGFNRIAEFTEKLYGGMSKENADDNVRTILMYKAVKRLKQTKDVRFYKKSLEKGSFIAQLNELVSQFRESGITPQDLALAAEKQGGSLAMKLFDISRLYAFYMDELDKAGMQDTLSAIARSVRQVKDHRYFRGMTVFVDSFNDFSYDELKMLDACIEQCKSMTVSLCIDNESVKKYANHPFADTLKTLQQITDLAAAHNYKVDVINCSKNTFRSAELRYVSKELYNTCKKPFDGRCENVSVISATDIYEESEFVSSKIWELVREHGYKFSDIAVLARSLKDCASVFEGTFDRYEIPYFSDHSDSVSASSLVRYINSLFKCLLSKKYSTDNILKYIKSPLCAMLNIEISNLEDYCIRWSVDGDMWLEDFTVAGDLSEKQLESINRSRRKIIEPFEEFKSKLDKNLTAGELCRALYDLLSRIELSQQTYSVVKKASVSDNETQLEMARGLKQLWNSVLSAIKSIYDCMNEDVISLRQFYELFKLMLSQMSVSRPPQKLDCVRICDPSHSRLDGVRAVFLVEVNDGIFPAAVSSGGLITENEKMILEGSDIHIAQSARKAFQAEKLVCYNAMTIADEKLYVLYSESDLVGEARHHSALISELNGMFGKINIKAQDMGLDFYCTSFRTAYYKYMEHSRDKSAATATIKTALGLSSEYAQKLGRTKSLHENGDYELSAKTAEKLFMAEQPTKVSPTQLDTYYKCPFNYFCKYGLGLKTVRKVDIDGMNKGLIIHQLLEKIMRNTDYGTGFDTSFLKLSDDEIKEYIHQNVTEYIKESLGGMFGKSPSFVFLQERLEDNIFHIVLFMQHELLHSKFRPALLEYKIDKAEEEDRLIIDVNGRDKIILTGIIDRVDIFDDENGEKYVRIIDYKTGKIDLKYSMLYNGLNLQMFVYLTALLETKNPVNIDGGLKQAGIVYYALGQSPKPYEQSEKADDDSSQRQARLKAFKPIGKVVDIKAVTDAFNSEEKGAYSPLDFKAKGIEGAVPDEFFTKLRNFATAKVSEFGQNLCNGNIHARPVGNACAFCDFHDICGRINQEDEIDVNDKIYEEKLMAELSDGKEEN